MFQKQSLIFNFFLVLVESDIYMYLKRYRYLVLYLFYVNTYKNNKKSSIHVSFIHLFILIEFVPRLLFNFIIIIIINKKKLNVVWHAIKL